jgi:hypothetical protein
MATPLALRSVNALWRSELGFGAEPTVDKPKWGKALRV